MTPTPTGTSPSAAPAPTASSAAPAGLTATPPVGSTAARTTSAPTVGSAGAPWSPATGSNQTKVVSQLTTLGNAIASAALPQASAQVKWYLQTIVESLKRLTHTDPAAVQILLTLHVGQAARTVQSLVGRVILLNQLIEYLTHVDPAAARRLASALPVLHRLLFDLIVSAGNGTGITVAGRVPIVNALGRVYSGVLSPTHQLLQLLAADGAVAAFTTAAWATGSPARSSSSVGVRIIGGRTTIKRPAAATASGSVAAPPVLSPPLAEGAPAGVSGGVSSGVGASTALIASSLTVSLLYALLGERVVLTLFPWRSTLLATRLERPG